MINKWFARENREIMGIFSSTPTKTDNQVLCFDLGSSTIRAAVVSKKNNRIIKIESVLECEAKGIKRGVILNRMQVERDIIRLLDKMENKTGYKFNSTYVTTGGLALHYKNHSGRRVISENTPVSGELIEEMLDECNSVFNDQEFTIIQSYSQEYRIDQDVVPDNVVGTVGNLIETDYLVVACKKSGIDNIYTTFKHAGLEIEDIIPGPIAAAETLLSADEKEMGSVVVDMGANTTSVALYYDGEVRHMSVLPIAGQTLTSDIKAAWQLHIDQAEKLKRKFGIALPSAADPNLEITVNGRAQWAKKEVKHETLGFVIEARLEEIFANVTAQIDKSGYFEKLGTGIILCGGSSHLGGIEQFISKSTGLQCVIGVPNIASKDSMSEILKKPEYTKLLGMLLMANSDCASNSPSMFGSTRESSYKQKPTVDRRKTKKNTKSSGSQIFPDLFSGLMSDPGDVELEK